MSKYMKSIAALVTGVLGWGAVVVASPSAAITAPEWLMLAVAAATSLGVYGVSNTPPAPPTPIVWKADPPAPPAA